MTKVKALENYKIFIAGLLHLGGTIWAIREIFPTASEVLRKYRNDCIITGAIQTDLDAALTSAKSSL